MFAKGKLYENRKEFHKAFKEFLWEDDKLALLSGCGWNDGGCRSLMRALNQWLGSDQVKTYQIVKSHNEVHSEHALIKVGEYFVDGDGVSTHDELYTRWIDEEGLPSVIVRPFEPELEPNSLSGEEPYYINDNKNQQLIKLLNETFNKENVLEILLKG